MYQEDDFLPISALQHLIFCERQCALIHIDGVWLDNALTVEGSHLHALADAGPLETRGDLVIVRAVPIRSFRLGITGRADVVEFIRSSPDCAEGSPLPGRSGQWRPNPVEYKRGRPKAHRADDVQLCAQALCLEEMLGTRIESGVLYYGSTRRRSLVPFDPALRDLTEESVSRLRHLLRGVSIPRAQFEPKCESCSLMPACMPKAPARIGDYLRKEVSLLTRSAQI